MDDAGMNTLWMPESSFATYGTRPKSELAEIGWAVLWLAYRDLVKSTGKERCKCGLHEDPGEAPKRVTCRQCAIEFVLSDEDFDYWAEICELTAKQREFLKDVAREAQ